MGTISCPVRRHPRPRAPARLLPQLLPQRPLIASFPPSCVAGGKARAACQSGAPGAHPRRKVIILPDFSQCQLRAGRGEKRLGGVAVSDLVDTRLDCVCELAELGPFPAKLRRVVRGLKLLQGCPLHVVDQVRSVPAAVQVDRNEPRLRGHETGALDHQIDNGLLIFSWQLHRRDLGTDAAFCDFGHDRPPCEQGRNAAAAILVSAPRRFQADRTGMPASAIATTCRAISACSRSTMRPSIWITPLPAFSGTSKAAMIFRAQATSSGAGENAALQGEICCGWISVLPSKPRSRACRHSVAKPSRSPSSL